MKPIHDDPQQDHFQHPHQMPKVFQPPLSVSQISKKTLQGEDRDQERGGRDEPGRGGQAEHGRGGQDARGLAESVGCD